MKTDFNKPFAIIKRKSDPDLIFLQGEVSFLDKLKEIPPPKGDIGQGHTQEECFQTISAIPFSQIKEKGFETHDSGEKISSIKITKQKYISMKDLEKILPSEEIEFDQEIEFEYSKDEYADVVRKIIKDEIGQGEGANFVIPRKGIAKIKNMSVQKALSIFKNLLKQEIGSHWTFIYFDGQKYLLGASPEAHIAVKNKRVKMHPISGTFRKHEHDGNIRKLRKELLNFLSDPKEINELFMVVDEELKIMADICSEGGMIIGPILKEMSHLIHSEYLLSGKSHQNLIDILRKSMFAATVIGGPLENACRIIKKYEKTDRHFYGSCIALMGTDENNEEFLDSTILIRSTKIDLEGNVNFGAGATLVRNSDPKTETKETETKIEALLKGISGIAEKLPRSVLTHFEEDDEVLEAMYSRNQKLSKFWFFNQEDENNVVSELKGKKVLIINNVDDFCFMMKHILASFGMEIKILKWDLINKYNSLLQDYDLIIIGPGTGNPNNKNDQKIQKIFNIVDFLIKNKRKFMGVCLGHQILCRLLGIEVIRKKTTFQGVQEEIDLFGKKERVGFYNTFAGKILGCASQWQDIKIASDKKTGEIFALKSKNFIGVQFHPESILTQNGAKIMQKLLVELFAV